MKRSRGPVKTCLTSPRAHSARLEPSADKIILFTRAPLPNNESGSRIMLHAASHAQRYFSTVKMRRGTFTGRCRGGRTGQAQLADARPNQSLTATCLACGFSSTRADQTRDTKLFYTHADTSAENGSGWQPGECAVKRALQGSD